MEIKVIGPMTKPIHTQCSICLSNYTSSYFIYLDPGRKGLACQALCPMCGFEYMSEHLRSRTIIEPSSEVSREPFHNEED